MTDPIKYNVLYADCPWSYLGNSGRNFQGLSKHKYNTLSIDDLKTLSIQQYIQDEDVLFLWATVPLLPEALQVMEAWGFKYRTKITWDKKSITTGFWFRNQIEDLLVGTKGKVKPFNLQKANIIQCMYGRHSQKPQQFRELINEAVANSFETPVKLELFARSRDGLFPDDEYKGWNVWGNQCNNSVQLKLMD